MSKSTEQSLGLWLLIGVFLVWIVLIGARYASQKRTPEAPVVAAVMAYTCYVAAALLAGAEFPTFLREHLFDGLAPAAAVGLLVNSFNPEDPSEALSRIRRPVMILIMFFAGSALIFGLIAAAAVFASGNNNFAEPVLVCAAFGGIVFPSVYLAITNNALSYVMLRRERVRWWFAKRPERTSIPEPGNPEDPPLSAPMDAAEDGAAPHVPSDDLPASSDTSQENR